MFIEQRREAREAPPAASQQATFRILAEGRIDAPTSQAMVENISGRGMRLRVDTPVAPGTAIRVDWNDTMILGEVTYCAEDAEGHCAIGIAVEHSLAHLANLALLRERYNEQLVAAPR